jgi:hypothetical protein
MHHRTLCACALSLFPLTALAGPDSVAVLLGSYHVGADSSLGLEEFNPGVFVNWHGAALGGRVDLGFGAFRNSYDGASVAVNAAYPLVRTPDWGFDLFTALALYPGDGDRFAHAIGDIVPIAGLQVRYRNVFVQAIPAGGQSVDATFTYGLVFSLD